MTSKRIANGPIAGPSKKRRNTSQLDPVNVSPNSTQAALTVDNPTHEILRTGKILRIQLKNFMCHDNLLVDLNKRINLLVGNNGSGKSAILTALIIGLGGKANATSRSRNIKQLIKRGETSASIEIHIANDGDDSYETEKYGGKVVIIRNIAQSGVSSYKLKNEHGTVISTTKSDLMKMMLYMNIQVENPVCILNQDASRSFLKDSDPKSNFQLFLKASQIESIIQKLDDCTVYYNAAKARLNYQRKLTKSLEEMVSETECTYRQLLSKKTFETEVMNYKCQQHWQLVIVQEDLCHEIETMIDENDKRIEEITQRNRNKNDLENEMRERLKTIAEKLDDLKKTLNGDLTKGNEIRTEVQTRHESLQSHKMAVNKNKVKQQRFQTDIEQLEKDISSRTESYSNRMTQMRRQNDEKLSGLKDKKSEINVMATNAKQDIQLVTNTKIQNEDEFRNMTERRKGIVIKAEQTSRQIQHLDTSSKDTLSLYGPHMPQLVAEIERLYNQRKFSELPRGPIGRYIEVFDDKWKGSIEMIIGSSMNAFCVNNGNDRMILQQLLKNKFPSASRIPIYTSKFQHQVYDVRRGQVREVPNTYLVMNLIQVSDSVVMNCLIDNCKIETILMAEDQDLAMHLTSEEENVPKNLSKIILLKPCTEFFPAPSYRMYSSENRRARYLQVNIAQRKMELQDELQQLKNEQNQLEDTLKNYQTKLKQMSRTLNEKRDVLLKFERNLAELQSEINALESVEYPPENEEDILRGELVELQRLLTICENEGKQYIEKLRELQDDLRTKENENEQIKIMIRKQENKIQEIEDEYNKSRMHLSEQSNNFRYDQNRMEKLQQDINQFKAQLQEANNKKERLQTTATKYGERVTSSLSHDELEKQIKDLNRKINAIAATKESIENIRQLLDTRLKEFKQVKEQTEALEATLKLLNKSRVGRYNWVVKLKQHMALRVQHKFSSILKLRNFTGEIKIDHENQLLELSVVPRGKPLETSVSKAKCLSGGERSYSTVAFLLALWSCVNHPFYFLDEYDVFTDQVNRFYMTRLLLSEAEKKPERQYTFLTPQDMSEIVASNTLTILRLTDPERNNE